MKYISEERLRYLFTGDCGFDLDAMLKNECQELNQWQTIDENTPKDKYLLLYSQDIEGVSKKFVGKLESAWYWKPTRWMELPPEPQK